MNNNYQEFDWDGYFKRLEDAINNDTLGIDTAIDDLNKYLTNLELNGNLTATDNWIIAEGRRICEEYNNKTKGRGEARTFLPAGVSKSKVEEYQNSSGYLNLVSIFVTIAAILIGLSIFVLYLING